MSVKFTRTGKLAYGDPPTIPVLNVSFYPNERGPYNLDTHIDANGYLLNPAKRWGGMMRKLDVRDFESANIGYIQFWLMDPFINDTLKTSKGGDLYFNLGEISEDVLKDGKKFYENGLPLTNNDTDIDETVWGKVPKNNRPFMHSITLREQIREKFRMWDSMA